jgi:large subunit ribosomal protein L22
MGKTKRERSLPDNEARAVVRNLRVSPRKLNLVAGMIRGKKVDHALADLEFSRKRIAQDVRKGVMSAIANAENNHNLDVNDLVVSEAWVGKNLVMKRFHARGRGRASSIMKPFSQITIIVRQTEDVGSKKKRAKKTEETAKSEGKPGGKSGKPAAQAKGDKPQKQGKPASEAAAKKTTKAGKSGKETE